MEEIFCVLDYETFSEANLKQVGAFEYSKHESTDIICVAWKTGTLKQFKDGTAKTFSWSPLVKYKVSKFSELLRALRNPKIILLAHNAFFEQCITANVFATKYMSSLPELREIPISRWRCTASYAAALGLPRKLEHAAKVLELSSQKDMEGNRLVLKWCKPRKPTKNNPATRHSDPEELKKIIQYCKGDVEAQADLFLEAPALNPLEKKIWELDQTINQRGFLVDRPLVEKILKLIDEEVTALDHETSIITNGLIDSTTKRDRLLKWLKSNDVFLPDLKAATVSDAIKENLVSGKAKRLLEIRQAVAKSSTKKYIAYEMRSRFDGRIRGSLLYHAAHHGRWAGSGIQPQNFPRGSIKDTHTACEIIREGDLDTVKITYGNAMNVFSSCLRSMIVGGEGKVLDVCDYAAIEARVLFWFADHVVGIKDFNADIDSYIDLASDIFRVPTEKIRAGCEAKDPLYIFMRFVGKSAFLGSGYGMGPPKFKRTCLDFGKEISYAVAQAAIKAYRTKHRPVVELWYNIERAAIAAVQNRGKRFAINKTIWWADNKFLWCELPSKRRLAFFGPEVNFKTTSWGDRRPELSHWGVDPKSKKWVKRHTYGGKLVENVVSGTARDLMAEAMLRIEEAGKSKIVLSVHDELVGERDKNLGSTEEFQKLMATLPIWGKGIPMKVEGWCSPRYKK